MKTDKEIFIFTIAYNCGKIVNKALESFHKYHNQKVHIFATTNDFNDITPNENNIYVNITNDEHLKQLYLDGHAGTAYVWSKVLKKEYGDYDKVIQFDSDVYFFDNCLKDITDGFNEGYDLIGSRRAYKNTKSITHINKDVLDNLEDVVGTFFIGVNLDKLSNYDVNTMQQMARGVYNPLGFPVIDFFDPISFDILKNGGKIKYLDFNDYGSCDENGSFDNDYLSLNTSFDFGKKIIHFAGIGSGMNFYYNGNGSVPPSYVTWAKKRFSLYMKLFYDEIDYEYDINDYNLILNSGLKWKE